MLSLKKIYAFVKYIFAPSDRFEKLGGVPSSLQEMRKYPIRNWKDFFVFDKDSYINVDSDDVHYSTDKTTT